MFVIWKTFMDGMDHIDIVDIVLVIGLLYIITTYYRNYGDCSKRPSLAASVTSVMDDDDSSGARGDVPRSNGSNIGRNRKNETENRLFRAVADVRADRYETVTAEIVGMRKRQEAMDKELAELRVGQTAAASGTSSHGIDRNFFGNVTDLDRKFCTLKVDFDHLQRTNEKLVRKFSGLKLRLGALERDVTTNTSVIIGSSYRARYSAFDGPSSLWTADHRDHTRTYSDGYQRHPINYYAIQTSPSVRTNNVVGPVPSCSPPPPPPPPPTPSSWSPPPPPPPPPPTPSPPPPRPTPPPKSSCPSSASISDPALKVYMPIPITVDILKSVTLVKAGSGIPKIKVPCGWITKNK